MTNNIHAPNSNLVDISNDDLNTIDGGGAVCSTLIETFTVAVGTGIGAAVGGAVGTAVGGVIGGIAVGIGWGAAGAGVGYVAGAELADAVCSRF